MAAAWHPNDDQSEARGGYEQWGLGNALSYFSIETELWGICGALGNGDWGFLGESFVTSTSYLLRVERFLILRLRRATWYKRHGGASFSMAKHTWC